MKTKVVTNYVFEGLGFPVTISSVELKAHGKDWFPVINTKVLCDEVFDFLLDNPVRLTGAQIAFIRKYMDMTQEQFARCLDITSHARISQWEKSATAVAPIRPVYLAVLRARMAQFRGRKKLDTGDFGRMVEGQLENPRPILISA